MRVPVSTYRLQFHDGFTFDDAAAVVPYLASLGVGDVYASPILTARHGSTHGYDVADPTALNPELGGRAGFRRLVAALREHGMGLLLDLVPNHMAMGSENPWWMDVLEHGRASRFAGFFDVDWEAPGLEGKVLVPVLGAPYGDVLDRGELRLSLEDGGLFVRYYDHRLPLDPATYGRVLQTAAGTIAAPSDAAARDVARRLATLARASERVPSRSDTSSSAVQRRARDAAALKRALRALGATRETRPTLERSVRAWGGDARGARAQARLDELVGEQAWVLANWRAAPMEVDYRRFFDISDLVALRSQSPAVFEATHALPLRLLASGDVTGLRIDHVDGLHDPLAYLRRLRRRARAPYVVVEKILGHDEELRDDWPVAGTTGYEFLNELGDVFVDPEGWGRLVERFRRLTGIEESVEDIRVARKRLVLSSLFASEVGALATRLQGLARHDRHGRDLTHVELADAIVAVTASLDVYRTYLRAQDVDERDLARIERAVGDARARSAADLQPALAFLRRVLLLDLGEEREEARASSARGGRARGRAWLAFVQRWQQLTGPAMAKGFEDTTLYVFNALVSRNEVGGDPGRPPVVVEDFHRANRRRVRTRPHSLLASSTHDSKRGEAVRARIAVLSEIDGVWTDRVARWREMNAARRARVGGSDRVAPDPNEETLLYQTLVGVWPLRRGEQAGTAVRVREYMVKALREAKTNSSWMAPDEAYERAVDRFVRSVLSRTNTEFRADFEPFARMVAHYGALNALSQTILKIAGPGVPDTYQGAEAAPLRLVDPDNRAPVDFARLARTLAGLDDAARRDRARLLARLVERWDDGRIQLFATSRALRARGANAELFADGSYAGVEARGPRRESVVAYTRRLDDAWALVVAPRLWTRLARTNERPSGAGVWRRTTLTLPAGAPGEWTDVFGGAPLLARPTGAAVEIPVRAALASFPVALLLGGAARDAAG